MKRLQEGDGLMTLGFHLISRIPAENFPFIVPSQSPLIVPGLAGGIMVVGGDGWGGLPDSKPAGSGWGSRD